MRKIQCESPETTRPIMGVTACDDPGPGGACHLYRVEGVDPEYGNPCQAVISFQKGGVGEVGVNGVTNEALLAIVADRLGGFQAGPYACGENAEAFSRVLEILSILYARTERRLAAGTEGTDARDDTETSYCAEHGIAPDGTERERREAREAEMEADRLAAAAAKAEEIKQWEADKRAAVEAGQKKEAEYKAMMEGLQADRDALQAKLAKLG